MRICFLSEGDTGDGRTGATGRATGSAEAKLKLLGGGRWVGKALKPAAGGAVEKRGACNGG